MGNSYGVPWFRGVGEQEAGALFAALDRDQNGFLTLKELMSGGAAAAAAAAAGGAAAAPTATMMPHSLPALYFFDKDRTGTLTRPEFAALLRFCEAEKLAVETSLAHDRDFRNLIHRASVAGVKDGSARGRNSFRRFSSFANVQSIFRKDPPPAAPPPPTSSSSPAAPAPDPADMTASSVSRPSVDAPGPHGAAEPEPPPARSPSPPASAASDTEPSDPHSGSSSGPDDSLSEHGSANSGVRMYSSQREFQGDADAGGGGGGGSPGGGDSVCGGGGSVCGGGGACGGGGGGGGGRGGGRGACGKGGKLAPLDAQSRTAVDAAVLENIMRANITKLAELLENEAQRVEFMEWLWKLTDFNRQGVVTLEELRIFLAALEEDGISLEELAFCKEGGVPLEESIVNEFDTTHTGLLTRDEFLVLADLVTREYEFWQNRHLDRVGDYELGRTIGRGSSGIVRIGIHVVSRAKVAIKIIKKGNCSALSRLDREIASLEMAAQENIVDLLEVLDSDENVFIVMELCGGGSLVDIVLLYPDERIPENIARNYLRQLFEALAFLHRNGICHRDIRLDNLMLSNAGVLKITDFGHSGVYHPGWDIFETTLVGSVYNLSPEQIEGRLYSGEKIDVWSGGIVAYCLLVGRPPFFESDMNVFLRSIQTGTFDVPDFISREAEDLIRCMIRVKPEDRIPYEQMLHHPWFYSGPESRPVMDTVVIPVDPFFKKRPDLAEMIMAGTIHEHNLHFHLADTANPNSFPGVLRGQAWALKCMSLDMNIKFTVSLFTTEPSEARELQQVYSCSKLLNAMDDMDPHDRLSSPGGAAAPVIMSSTSGSPADAGAPEQEEAPPPADAPRALALPQSVHGSPAAAPPARAEVAAPSPGNISISASVSEGELGAPPASAPLPAGGGCSGGSGDGEGAGGAPRARRSRGRSKSLDFSEDWTLRISRSVTVDAFPYQKVLPTREMPHRARDLNFDRPDGSLAGRADARDRAAAARPPHAAIEYRGLSRSRTLENLSAPAADISAALRSGAGDAIARRLIRHAPAAPTAPVAPAPPRRARARADPAADAASECSAGSSGGDAPAPASAPAPAPPVPTPAPAPASAPAPARPAKRAVSDTAAQPAGPEFMPYIEVKLLDGESGLFLRICRKLKTICDTKLANAAERQKRRVVGRRSLAVLRRTASQRAHCAAPPAPETIHADFR